MSLGFISQQYDDTKRIIYVKSQGILSFESVRIHQIELGRLMERCRDDIGYARIASDMNEAAVQTKEIAEMISDFMGRFYQSSDRIAVIVQSTLAKIQVRRILAGYQVEAFLSLSAAEVWLTANARPEAA